MLAAVRGWPLVGKARPEQQSADARERRAMSTGANDLQGHILYRKGPATPASHSKKNRRGLAGWTLFARERLGAADGRRPHPRWAVSSQNTPIRMDTRSSASPSPLRRKTAAAQSPPWSGERATGSRSDGPAARPTGGTAAAQSRCVRTVTCVLGVAWHKSDQWLVTPGCAGGPENARLLAWRGPAAPY